MQAKRYEMQRLMRYLISKEPLVHYAQVRPMRTAKLSSKQVYDKLESGGSISMDCSEALTCIAKWSGLSDPNDRSYNGTGNTDTMYAYLRHYYNVRSAGVGAFVHFGGPDFNHHHICGVLEAGVDPLLFSHGMERGPIAIRLSDEVRYHVGQPVTFLSIAKLL